MKTALFTQRPQSTNTFQHIISFFITAFLRCGGASLSAQDVLMGLTSYGGVEGKGTMFSYKTEIKAFPVINGFADWGQYPKSDLVQGRDGNLYGMTPQGSTYNYGTIFKMTSADEIKILKHLDMKADGGSPYGSLIVGKDGGFYGTASNGGVYYVVLLLRYRP